MSTNSSTGVDLSAALTALASEAHPALRIAEVPVSDHAIRTWCAALGEDNVVYRDNDAAVAAGLRGIIAPPALLQTWTMPIGSRAAAAAPTLHTQARRTSNDLGFSAVVATDYEQEFLLPIRPGDLLSEQSWIESVSPLKRTGLGPGHFVTIAFEFRSQSGELVGRMRARTLYFTPTPRTPIPRQAVPAQIPVGAPLPSLDIEISRTLIITGSLASNDHEPVHHDPTVAHAQGLDDIISSIVTTAGLVTRYVSAATSPSTSIRKMTLRLAQPAYPGDVLALRGHSAASTDGTLIHVTGSHARGTHVSATVKTTERTPCCQPRSAGEGVLA